MQSQPTRASNMPAVHSVLGARGAASAASAVGVAPGGGGLDGAALRDFLLEMTTGRPWRPAPSTHRRRSPELPSGLPLTPPKTAALGAENSAGSSAAADADARRLSSRCAASRRARRKAKAFKDNLAEDFDFLRGPAPAPPASLADNPATTTTSTSSGAERMPPGRPQVAEGGLATDFSKGVPETGVAPLRGPEYLNKRGRKELKKRQEAQQLGGDTVTSEQSEQESAKHNAPPSDEDPSTDTGMLAKPIILQVVRPEGAKSAPKNVPKPLVPGQGHCFEGRPGGGG